MPGCKQYNLAVQVMRYAAELAQAMPEPNDRATAPDRLSWRRYCQDAACDLERAAEAESVSDALKQQQDQYAADTHADGTQGSSGRAAAAKMLRLACQALIAGKNPRSVAARLPRWS